MATEFYFYISLFTGLSLTGLIWVIQWVHYPSFHFIEMGRFKDFCRSHQSRMTHVVAPLMVIELISTLWGFQSQMSQLSLFSVICVVLIWLFTFFISVPLHTALLDKGYKPEVVDRLIFTNWPRTVLWSFKSGAMIVLILQKI